MSQKNIGYFLLIIIGIIILGVVFFYPKKKTDETIKIGASLPIFNNYYGRGCLTGIELAIKEINDAGGINGKKIELRLEDDRCDPKEGISAVNKLINIDKVIAMVGPLCSSVASSVLSPLQENKVPTIILGTAAGLTKNKDYIFRITPSDDLQGSFTAEYIYNDLKKNKVAIIYVKNDWGQGIHDIFVERYKELGGTITFDEGVEQGSTDLRSTFAKLKNKDSEIIYFPAFPIELLAGLKQMKELDINKPVISGDSTEVNEVLNSELAEGVMYATGKYSEPEEFKQKVKKNLNQESHFIAPICYDAINAFKTVIEKEGTNREKIREGLGKINITGVSTPQIEFNNERELKNPQFEIKIIKNKKPEVIKSE